MSVMVGFWQRDPELISMERFWELRGKLQQEREYTQSARHGEKLRIVASSFSCVQEMTTSGEP